MELLLKLVPLPQDIVGYILIDIVIALFLLLLIRWLSGATNKISVTEELSSKDNFAFGISIAGRMLALCIVLAAVVGRHIGLGYEIAAMGTLLFGAIGIVLIKIGRVTHDKLILHRLDKDQTIAERNTSVAIVDASSAIATAIIIHGSIQWVQGTDTNAVVGILTGFFIVLMILLLTTRLYELRFAKNNQNDSFQGMLRRNNLALGIQHSGNLIGTALVVSGCGRILAYDAQTYITNITGWLIGGVIAALSLAVVVGLAKRLVLVGINWKQEVDVQDNIGVAALEWVLSVGLAAIVIGALV
jgi:uncharacterized membrane protein YjfL (UPF0719 family)